jgi:ribosome-associated heat shock protein Hsp15
MTLSPRPGRLDPRGEAKPGAIRLDRWLWQARFAKSRARAAALIESGAIRINSVRVLKPATPLRVGDGLSFALGGRVHALRVLGLGTRRGPALEARGLYLDLDAGPPTLEPDREAGK